MRLIKADDLITFANLHKGHKIDSNDIARFPTIEAEPVRHGRWKWNIERTKPFCSECAEEPWRESNTKLPNYCPNCGAKMDLEG